ncbi:MAG: tRNA (adenosine(37)-N6)-threonylcarbamoyltransferase complex dimerization subunit type 1 TsaB [Eubacteriales bacterium]
MRILAFETSAKAASVALLQDGNLLAETYQNNGQTHSRTILVMAEDLLKNCDLTPKDVDAIACANGPGSFTGVRIGVAAAKGLAWGLEIPLVGVSTIAGMANMVEPYGEAYIIPAMDARRSQVYTGVFQKKEGILTQIVEDSAISVEELGNLLKNLSGRKILVGDGANLCYNMLKDGDSSLILPEGHCRMQRASGVALEAMKLLEQPVTPAAQVVPNYLRLSQAEREKAERNKNK